ncbi:MAG TPA: BTAD domain-containing putative transcriptional regulator [Acidimicrobiales bacterium]
MEFDILGPIAVRTDGHVVRLGAAKRRVLLALLLLEANRPVSTERLLAALFGEAPPPATGSTVHSHIAQLRKALGPERLERVPGGYRLSVEEGELDAANFESELGQAQMALGSGLPTEAAEVLERALGRWHGLPLSDAGGAEWVASERRRLNELHVVAEETLLDVHLALRQNEEVIELAQSVIREDPGREPVWACLMLALYRSGRSADAVRAYQELRGVLQADGGRAPSAELVKLERSILHRDPALRDAQRPKVLTPTLSTTTPGSERPLPSGVVTFLMTDVVGSTRLWETAPAAMREALARHDELMKMAVESHDGVLLRERGEGDSTFSVFQRATDAAAAALSAQLSLTDEPWPPECVISVRMAMHTGEASERDGDYYGRPVNRVARLRAIAEGGQILVGHSAAEILLDHLPAEASLVVLGVRELRDFDRPETVYCLGSSVPAPGGRIDDGNTAPLPVALGAPTAPPAVVTPDPGPTAAPLQWEAVVEVDRAYYEQSGDIAAPLPPSCPPQVIALTEMAVMIGRRTSGRDSDPFIDLSGPFADPGVSRVHAVLTRQSDGSYTLLDPGSTNGTFLNNMEEPIRQLVPVALKAGDCIYLGAWTRIQLRAH